MPSICLLAKKFLLAVILVKLSNSHYKYNAQDFSPFENGDFFILSILCAGYEEVKRQSNLLFFFKTKECF